MQFPAGLCVARLFALGIDMYFEPFSKTYIYVIKTDLSSTAFLRPMKNVWGRSFSRFRVNFEKLEILIYFSNFVTKYQRILVVFGIKLIIIL